MYKFLFTSLLGFTVFFGSFQLALGISGLLTPGVVRQSSTAVLPGISGSTIGDQNNLWAAGWFTNLYVTNMFASSTSFTRSGGALDMAGYAITNAGAITGTSLTATSTTASSTVYAGLSVGTTTTNSTIRFDVYGPATSSIRIDSNNATSGACLILRDNDGAGYTYVSAINGVLVLSSTVSCL